MEVSLHSRFLPNALGWFVDTVVIRLPTIPALRWTFEAFAFPFCEQRVEAPKRQRRLPARLITKDAQPKRADLRGAAACN
jgi:hypothetical protein